ncbi:MAG: hypothetical protein K2Q22_02590 [Cytophagales bacterium]|nr:hypothetical protein [Cytophagales bacterium]
MKQLFAYALLLSLLGFTLVSCAVRKHECATKKGAMKKAYYHSIQYQ